MSTILDIDSDPAFSDSTSSESSDLFGTDLEDSESNEGANKIGSCRREKFGRNLESRRRDSTLESFYIEKCVEEYLGCKIKPWKTISSLKDKVEIESIPSEFVPALKPYRPVLARIDSPSGTQTIKLVCGYRELMTKRATIQKLYWNELENKLKEKIRVTPRRIVKTKESERHCWDSNTESRCEERIRATNDAPLVDTWSSFESDSVSTILEENAQVPIPKLGQMAQRSRIDTRPFSLVSVKESLSYRLGSEFIPVGGGDSDTEVSLVVVEEQGGDSSRQLTFDIDPSDSEVQINDNPSEITLETTDSVNISEAPADGARTSITSADSGGSSGGGSAGSGEPHEEAEDEDEGGTIKIDEKDNEWLQLTSSDSDEILLQYDPVPKIRKPWMNASTSYESQNFAHTIQSILCYMAACLPLPIYARPDELIGLIVFSISRSRSAVFRIIFTLIWVIVVIIVEAALDVFYGTENELLRILEKTELSQYAVPLMGIGWSLGFLAFWSMALMLKDSFIVCQFLNFLGASLTKVEMSGIRHVWGAVLQNFIVSLVYCTIIILSFVFDKPRLTRESCGFLVLLICRPFFFRVRIFADDYLLYFQIAGLVLHLFCYISMRSLFTLMHVLAIIIGNLAKNWNFRFGLSFAQFGTQGRGHFFRLHLGQSLIKLFNHHRLITALTRLYGSVFAIPIITYYIIQIGMLSVILIFLVFTLISNEEKRGQFIPIPTKNRNFTLSSRYEELATSGFVLANFLFEFVFVSEVISKACAPVREGFEFVRRHGLLRCKNTHELRLLMSLQWSMSAKNPALINVNKFFYVNRPGILSSIGFSLLIVSLVIQLKQTSLITLILQCINETNPSDPTCYELKRVSETDYKRIQLENRHKIELHFKKN